MDIKPENYYYLRYKLNCFIVTGYDLKDILSDIDKGIVKITDIAGNYLLEEYTNGAIYYQELYRIDKIYLK